MADRRDYNEYDFRDHHRNRYGSSGRSFDDYRAAYLHGWEMASTGRYMGQDWNEAEREVRHHWETTNPSQLWTDMRDAIEEGYRRGKLSIEDLNIGQPHRADLSDSGSAGSRSAGVGGGDATAGRQRGARPRRAGPVGAAGGGAFLGHGVGGKHRQRPQKGV